MQATNKSDATQVYESAERATKTGIKDIFRYILKPFTIFSYHYFVEGIKAVQRDGPTKELEKLTNLSYDETIKVMEKCQKDGIRVVASERKLVNKDNEFGKRKSLFQQKRTTRYARRIKSMSDFKAHFPTVAKLIHLNYFIRANEEKQEKQVALHENKRYNIYFNKSRQAYMGERIADLLEYRTKISKELFDDNTQNAIEEIKKEGMTLNSQQLKDLSEKFKLHEIGEVGIEEFKKDYCIHSMPFGAFMRIKDDLEATDIPYGLKVITDDEDNKQSANIYFENKHLERYSELGFNNVGQIRVYGSDNKNMEWNINSQDEIISFKTNVGEQEKQTYETLSGKNYVMKRTENECIWTVLKNDIRELAEKEKKRNVVNEDFEKHNIFEELEKEVANTPTVTENQNIEINLTDEKEVDK
jgi:hypothetical protein